MRELGLRIGELDPGPSDSIADVSGIRVGHVTVWRDEPEPPEGRGTARTGVTAVVPESLPLRAGVAVLNGAGELTGSHGIREWGQLDTPVYLTATMAVGRVFDGAVSVAVASDPSVGVDDVLIPVVGECDDSDLSEARVVQVEGADAGRAVEGATGWPFDEGAVGAGTGMTCLGWKGGIGTASRVAGDYVVGVLVLANFGGSRQLRIAGVPVGELMPGEARADPAGSCIAVVATDASLSSASLERVARRGPHEQVALTGQPDHVLPAVRAQIADRGRIEHPAGLELRCACLNHRLNHLLNSLTELSRFIGVARK